LRLLVDQNLPRRLVALLLAAAHEAAHTEDEGLATATDPVILSWCCTHDRTLVTADKKMTKFFSGSGSTCPSVLVVRDLRTLAVERIAAMLVANLEQIESIPAYTDTSSEPLGSLSIVPRRRFHRVPEQATQEGWRSLHHV
jgi:predicted nuclease of predicted toxin-antitoxin system